MNDLISRQAAIDAIENAFDRETILNRFVRKIAISAVRMLPSAEPEIIRCKDCRYNNNCEIQYSAQSGDEFFCGRAERREDE